MLSHSPVSPTNQSHSHFRLRIPTSGHIRRTCTRHRVHANATGTPSPAVGDEAAGRCPVLRSVRDLPTRNINPILTTFSLFFDDAFTAQGKLVQNDPMAFLPSANGDRVIMVGDANLVREVMSDDETWPAELPIKAFLGEEGLLFLNGTKHSRVRALMAGAFSADEIEKYTPKVQDLATKYINKAVAEAAAGKKVTALEVMRSFTFDIICSVVAGLKLSEEEMLAMVGDYESVENSFLGAVLPIPKGIFNLPFMPGGKGMAARQRILDRVQANVDQAEAKWRKGESLSGQGLLQELIAAGLQDPNKRLTRTQLGDSALLFLLAGFDTTAALITSAVYFLNKYPQYWQAVVKEQEQILEQYGPNITPQILRKMEVTERVVRETLRLRGPAAQNMRVASRDTVLGGVQVPAGWKVFMPLAYINTSDPTFTTQKSGGSKNESQGVSNGQPAGQAGVSSAADAGNEGEDSFGMTVFNPDRFAGVKGYGQQMAFGYGKHYCLGSSLAMMEAKVMLAILARGYNVKVTKEPDSWRNIPVVKPTNDLPVVITAR